ncbi:MAG: hypothetical protein QW650_00080 [Thermofilum sp.]
MMAIELLERYADLVERLREGFEGFLESAKRIEVVPWRDEFAVADKNPEVFFQIERLRKELEEGRIDWKVYKEMMEKLAVVPTCVTMGVAFIEEGKVSFRKVPPPADVLIHEVGHVHFRVGDLYWSSEYGGGELLVWAHLKRICDTDEEKVKSFMEFYELATHDAEKAHKIFLERLAPFIRAHGIAPHVAALLEFMGCLVDTNIPIDPSDPSWKDVPVKKEHVLNALGEIVSGVCVSDPSFLFLAKKMGWIF